MASYLRPLHLEQVHCLNQVPHGNHQIGSPVYSSGQLDVLIDLEDGYLQVPIHLEIYHLWFVCQGLVYQFKVLCFILMTAPQVYTQAMAPVLTILH